MSGRVLRRDMSVIDPRTLNFIKLLINIIPIFNSLWQSKTSDYRLTRYVEREFDEFFTLRSPGIWFFAGGM
jgi:hypothetical protein